MRDRQCVFSRWSASAGGTLLRVIITFSEPKLVTDSLDFFVLLSDGKFPEVVQGREGW